LSTAAGGNARASAGEDAGPRPSPFPDRRKNRMTLKLSSLAIDVKRETDGEWFDIAQFPGLRLKLRGFGYGPYLKAKSIVEGRWVRKYGRDPVPPEIQYRENGKLYSDFILVGWDGLDEAYSQDRGLEILQDPGYRWLHDEIRFYAGKIAEVDAEFVEDSAKNSERSSAGNSAAGQ
jgi:hypothetical protein